MRLIVLAAGEGRRLRPLTADRPKCLVELAGRPLLDWQLAAARACGIDEVVVIGGHGWARLEDHLAGRRGVTLVRNPDYAATDMVHTLFCGRAWFADGYVMSYGDIVYAPRLLRAALAGRAEVGVVVDRGWRGYWQARFADPLSDAESLRLDPSGRIVEIGLPAKNLDEIEAQYIGLVAFRGAGVAALQAAYDAAHEAAHEAARAQAARGGPAPGGRRRPDGLHMTDLLRGMIGLGTPVHAVPADRGWAEIDGPADLALAERLAAEGELGPGPDAAPLRRAG